MPSALSLLNPRPTLEQLECSPSRRDGISSDLEEDMRGIGCRLIQDAGILCKIPQATIATAQVLFQRFFYVASLRRFAVLDMASASLFLAAKLGECATRISSLTLAFDHVAKRLRGQPTDVFEAFSQEAYDYKTKLIVGEMQLLKRLGFHTTVQLPYGLMINYLRILGLEEREDVANKCWALLNDGLATPIYILFTPQALACAAIDLSCRLFAIRLPDSPPESAWYELFDTNREEMDIIIGWFARLYLRRGNIALGDLVARPENFAQENGDSVASNTLLGTPSTHWANIPIRLEELEALFKRQ
ncbi:hypothetical protein BZG36_02116 [Bifiguratus adelaidae]|uniref:Cyclin N-terminal domain-containing protein n=1 Tax=Bifiguratus adelaidae TaxID=1938954 RepID=A0A261Y348_9FUNG|nr:hypothetical protein BZG36_02116 [Bifiguratus adelaidae]